MGGMPSLGGIFLMDSLLGVLSGYSGEKGVESLCQILIGHVAREKLSEVFVSRL